VMLVVLVVRDLECVARRLVRVRSPLACPGCPASFRRAPVAAAGPAAPAGAGRRAASARATRGGRYWRLFPGTKDETAAMLDAYLEQATSS
jgi:hypothetical protein